MQHAAAERYAADAELVAAEARLYAAQQHADATAGHSDATVRLAASKMLQRSRKHYEGADETHRTALQAHRAAHDLHTQARFVHDATPAGVASLDHAIATAGDRQHQEQLRVRRDRALARLNNEAAQRSSKWGTRRGWRVPIDHGLPASAGGDPALQHIVDCTDADGIMATAVDYGESVDEATGRSYLEYEVTYFRPDRQTGKVRRMPVRYRSEAGDEPPTVSGVLHRMGQRATMARKYPNARALIAQERVPAHRRAAVRQDYQEARTYRDQLARFLGSRLDHYLPDMREDQ